MKCALCSRKEVRYAVFEGDSGQYSEEVQSEACGRRPQAAEKAFSGIDKQRWLPRGTGTPKHLVNSSFR